MKKGASRSYSDGF